MNAEQMFKRLGFFQSVQEEGKEDILTYESINYNMKVEFDLTFQAYRVLSFDIYEEENYKTANIFADLHKVIHEQLKELGWI